MRLVAFAGLALALVLAAAVLLTGGPQLTWADTSSPQESHGLASSQAVDDVQIEMVLNNQPETLFPAQVISGTTEVTPGTRSAAGRVIYSVETITVTINETIRVFDPAGIVVHTETFQISPSASSGVHPFTVTGSEMFSVYRDRASSRLTTAQSQANSLQPATTALVTDTISTLTSLTTVASEANTALGRLLAFTEVVSPTRLSVLRAQSEIQAAISTADNLARLGIAIPEFCNRFADPDQRRTCLAEVTRKVGIYNTDLPNLKTRVANALAAYNAVSAALASLTDLQIPPINECGTSGGRPVPRTYTSNVIETRPQAEPQTRDSWEWQVANPSTFKDHATLQIVPPQIYLLSVNAPGAPHEAEVLATIYDTRCVPVRDNVDVVFSSTIGSLEQTAVRTFSEGGVHGLARTRLRPGDAPGSGLVFINELNTYANVTIIGPASQLTFLSASGDTPTSQLYIAQGVTVTLQVQVRDRATNIVADGTQVQFSVTGNAGRFTQNVVSTVNGMARVQFIANQSSQGSAVITAQAVGTQASAQLNVVVVGPPANIQLGVQQGYSTTLYIGSRNEQYPNFTFVEATVTDAAGQPVADGTVVEMRLTSANRATWEDPADTSGLSTRVVTSGGKARAKLQVLDDAPAGSLNVIALIGTLRSSPLSLTLSSNVPNPPPPPSGSKIFLPMVLKRAQCGRLLPGGGCSGPQN